MSAPSQTLRVLHIEDSEDDFELTLQRLRQSGYTPLATRVDNERAMRDALLSDSWDVVLSDCSMPGFSAQNALTVLSETALDIPFIIVSGSIAEEIAVAAIRAGAHDFIRKDKLDGLGAAVRRELQERNLREAGRKEEIESRASAARYRALFNMSATPVWAFDMEALDLIAANESALAVSGFSRSELAAMSLGDLVPVDAAAAEARSADETRACQVRAKSGRLIDVAVQIVAVEGRRIAVVTAKTQTSPRLDAPYPQTTDGPMDLAERVVRRATKPAPSRPSLLAALAARRVLLADDDAERLASCERTLTKRGCLVETAPTSEVTQAYLGHAPFDVIVTNVRMTGTTAIDLLRTVRERDADIPIVLFSEKADVPDAVRAVEQGAFGYLTMPAEIATVPDVIRHAIEMHRLAALKRQALSAVEPQVFGDADGAGLDVRFARALDALWIAFQPIVSWGHRTVFGYEALVRSDEPSLRSPADLFSAAEQLGRLPQLGRAIRARVADAVSVAPFPYRLFVNVHADDLNDGELYSAWAPLSALATSVVLEITERSSLQRVGGLGARLKKLRGLGFQIAVDDLGAGYAGLSSFSELEPEVVKLDMSLIRGIATSTRRQSVVRAMVELAGRDLGMLVVCEGVETAAERDALAGIGADLQQGYLFAKPSREWVTPTW